MLHSGNLDFSFAGLKTAVLTQLRKAEAAGLRTPQFDADLSAAFVAAIVDVLVAKAMTALRETGLKTLVVAGGVGANRQLRAGLDAAAAARGVRVHYPELAFCTDNGAMIALAGALRLRANPAAAVRGGAFGVQPRWDLADA